MSRKRSHNQMQPEFRPGIGELFRAFENGYIYIKKLLLKYLLVYLKQKTAIRSSLAFSEHVMPS